MQFEMEHLDSFSILRHDYHYPFTFVPNCFPPFNSEHAWSDCSCWLPIAPKFESSTWILRKDYCSLEILECTYCFQIRSCASWLGNRKNRMA